MQVTKGIEVKDLRFSYPGNDAGEVLKGVSLRIQMGESLAVVGQNGAGKTTLSKMLNGTYQGSSGEILLNGQRTESLSMAQIAKQVAYVYQNPDDQIFNNTVEKEICYAAHYHRLDAKLIQQRLASIAEFCGIAGILSENPYEVPLSIRKLITIASVLIIEPDVLILDEPTAGQDYWGLEKINQVIAHMIEQKKTVLTITHDMDFVLQNFSRVLAMAQGQIQFDGSPTELFQQAEVLQLCKLKAPNVTLLRAYLGLTADEAKNARELAALCRVAKG